jgi:hypothetical protein
MKFSIFIQEERRQQEDERRRMEREKRQEFVERTKNLLTSAESQVTSEKSQRSTGGTKKVFHLIFFYQKNLHLFLVASKTRRGRSVHQ